jgi:hypothetical protein
MTLIANADLNNGRIPLRLKPITPECPVTHYSTNTT